MWWLSGHVAEFELQSHILHGFTQAIQTNLICYVAVFVGGTGRGKCDVGHGVADKDNTPDVGNM